MRNKGLIALEDGSVFYGESFGADGEYVGEIVFNTATTGYQETITDPSYLGQIILFCAPQIGNVGVNHVDMESQNIHTSGMIVHSYSDHFSNWRGENDLARLLIDNNKIGITGIDTRALTKKIREKGALRGCIMAGLLDEERAIKQAQKFQKLEGQNLISELPVKEGYYRSREESSQFCVVVIDFGVKRSILNAIADLGCLVYVVPASTAVEKILACNPDGVVLSNGPGDPTACSNEVLTIKKLIQERVPIFGICFGFQLLALASGAKIKKMEFGHHGINHPVIDINSKKVFISSQNHIFCLEEETLDHSFKITHRSLFDGSPEGFLGIDKPIIAFQGHPEGGPGPNDFSFFFSKFYKMMEQFKCQNALISRVS